MGLRQSSRVAAGALLLTCELRSAHTDNDPRTTMLGVAPGLYDDMAKQVIAPMLKEGSYKMAVHEFSGCTQPDMAPPNDSIGASLSQYSLYFDKLTTDKGLKLSKLIVVPTAGVGFYLHKIKNLDELRKGDVTTLSSDPTNPARGLHFLQSTGLITTKGNIGPAKAPKRDIISSPKGLVFGLLEMTQLSYMLDGVVGTPVNGNFAVAAEMDLANAIKQKYLDENLKNIIAIRSGDVDKLFVKGIVEAVKSPAYRTVTDNPQNIYSAFQKLGWMSTAR